MNNSTQESRIDLILLETITACFERASGVCCTEPDLEVRARRGTSAEALESSRVQPWTWCCWISTSAWNMGSHFISAAQQAGYQGRFLIVAGSADVRDSAIALKLGASGIFLKSETPDAFFRPSDWWEMAESGWIRRSCSCSSIS